MRAGRRPRARRRRGASAREHGRVRRMRTVARDGCAARVRATAARADSEAARRARRSIAVTGANTFLGRNIVGLLEEDDAIARIVVIDVKNPTHCGGEDRVLRRRPHAAGGRVARRRDPATPSRSTRSCTSRSRRTRRRPRRGAHELESVGTMHVLAACSKHRLRKLVVRSTVLVYGPHPSNPNFLTERHPLRGLRGSHFVDGQDRGRAPGAQVRRGPAAVLRDRVALRADPRVRPSTTTSRAGCRGGWCRR